jgi:hypothetical protein
MVAAPRAATSMLGETQDDDVVDAIYGNVLAV